MLRNLTDYRPDEFHELLVDIDAMFMDLASEPYANQVYCTNPTFSDKDVALRYEGILEGELGKPSHIYVYVSGEPRFRFKSLDSTLEGNMGYDSFDALRIEEQFPAISKMVEAYLLREHGADLTEFRAATVRRYKGKPQMIDLANDALNHGRKMRACHLLEQEGEAKDSFYDRQDDFGQF